MDKYNGLKDELLEIAKIIDKFPCEIKEKVFDLLTSEYFNINSDGKKESINKPKGKKQTTTKMSDDDTKSISQPKRNVSKESYSIDGNLDLQANGNIPSFKSFVDEKKPTSCSEFNTVSVYYLKRLKETKNVTLNHIYTCYTEVKKRPPKAFRHRFTDTKTQKGWVEFDAEGNLEIPHRGAIFVENDLPKVK